MKMEKIFDELSIVLGKEDGEKATYDEYFSAAVLVPLILENNQLAVLFEIRSAKLSWQPGEICFPGGRIEKSDNSSIAAAVRETTEELGISTGEIQVIGALPEVISPIGVRLYPAVAYLHGKEPINAGPDEVAEVFTVPLEFLLKTEPIIGKMERCTRPLADFPFALLPGYSEKWKRRRTYEVLFYQYKDYVIWGLTAQVLHNFLVAYRKLDLQ